LNKLNGFFKLVNAIGRSGLMARTKSSVAVILGNEVDKLLKKPIFNTSKLCPNF